MENVLIIDDDRELCELVAELLGEEGFAVEFANRSEAGLERALAGQHALVVLHVMMLTARGDDVDRIVGLEIGADDYLPKPFNPRELVARIQAILRRARPARAEVAAQTSEQGAPARLRVGDVEIDTGTRQVWRGGEAAELTNVEYEILVQLLSAAGLVVRREDLVRTV